MFKSVPLSVLRLHPMRRVNGDRCRGFDLRGVSRLLSSMVIPLMGSYGGEGVVYVTPRRGGLRALRRRTPSVSGAFRRLACYCISTRSY